MAESRSALPVVATYSALACLAAYVLGMADAVVLVCLFASAFLMMMLNNTHALIRIFSRMVSCAFLMMAVMCVRQFEHTEDAVVCLCYVLFFTFFFKAYQDKQAVGCVFYAFAMIGIMSVFSAQVLFFVPVLWLVLFSNIMAGGWRTLSASVLGLLAPYWVLAAHDLYCHDLDRLTGRLAGIDGFAAVADFSVLSIHELVSAAVVVLLCIIGVIHFYRTSYRDKIQVRMYHETFALLSLLTLLFIVLQPQNTHWLLPMLMVSSAPLVGHFVALTETRLTNAFFLLAVVGMVVLTAYNLFLP